MATIAVAQSTPKRKTTRVYAAPKRAEALVRIFESPDRRSTAKAAGISSGYIYVLEAQGLVIPRDIEHTGKRGRPAIIWGLTDKGRKRAARLVEKAANA